MRQSYKVFIQLQVIMMVVTILLGAIALYHGNLFLALVTCFCLALSFTFEGLVEWKKKNTLFSSQQFLRAIIIIIFVCYLYFK